MLHVLLCLRIKITNLLTNQEALTSEDVHYTQLHRMGVQQLDERSLNSEVIWLGNAYHEATVSRLSVRLEVDFSTK